MAAGSEKRLALARRMAAACETDVWKDVIRPYIEGERDMVIELTAAQTNELQLMRFAGALQTLNTLLRVEDTARQTLREEAEKKDRNPDYQQRA